MIFHLNQLRRLTIQISLLGSTRERREEEEDEDVN